MSFVIGALLIFCGCVEKDQESSISEVNRALELDKRLTSADFSIIKSEPEVVKIAMEMMTQSVVIPEQWRIEFAGQTLDLPDIEQTVAQGYKHDDGRMTIVYMFQGVKVPDYGKFIPLAIAQYIVPEKNLQIVLLLVCFQSDPEGGLSGISVRSLDISGVETAAPFALAANCEDLKGKFFYNEFLDSADEQRIAGRSGWNRGFLLLSKLSKEVILSTYLSWY